jgi:hypothetical protein
MYNSHRPPIGVPAPPANARLGELLDQVRAEFEGQATRAVEYEGQRMFALFLLSSPASCMRAPAWSRARTITQCTVLEMRIINSGVKPQTHQSFSVRLIL